MTLNIPTFFWWYESWNSIKFNSQQSVSFAMKISKWSTFILKKYFFSENLRLLFLSMLFVGQNLKKRCFSLCSRMFVIKDYMKVTPCAFLKTVSGPKPRENSRLSLHSKLFDQKISRGDNTCFSRDSLKPKTHKMTLLASLKINCWQNL